MADRTLEDRVYILEALVGMMAANMAVIFDKIRGIKEIDDGKLYDSIEKCVEISDDILKIKK